MKKLLLVALFVAVPALVLAQGTTTTTTSPAKTEVKKVESTTTSTATKTTEPTKEAAKTATTTKTTETVKTATTTPTTPEMILIGEVTNVDNTNKYFTLKVKETNKTEKISFKETNPNLKSGLKIKATYERDASNNLWLKRFEEHSYPTAK